MICVVLWSLSTARDGLAHTATMINSNDETGFVGATATTTTTATTATTTNATGTTTTTEDIVSYPSSTHAGSIEDLSTPGENAQAAPSAQWPHDVHVEYSLKHNAYIYTGDNGTSYSYDPALSAWIPVFDEELIKAQQSAYGVDEPEAPDFRSAIDTDDIGDMDIQGSAGKRKTEAKTARKAESNKRKKPNPNDAATKKRINTAVYVTGLPHDATVDELVVVFSKCGLILEDPVSATPKIKLYSDAAGVFKGDALVIFFKEESVQLAVDLLDDTLLREDDGVRIHVQKAVFQEKPANDTQTNAAGTDSSSKTSVENSTGDKKIDIEYPAEDGKAKNGPKANKVVVLRHMFTLKELDDDPTLLLDLKQDVREECERLGQVTNVVLFDLEEEGIMTIRFKEIEAAALCVAKMDGRFFGGQVIKAVLATGKEKFKQSKGQTEEEEKKRMEAYEAWLESQH
ncbi:hypothetical protein BASA62_000797 [Batrachochytrium salamandrivorans]|nr:hypothetical protein BASA62_000797 [Batrachochytrium salamandrivorans]